MDGGGGGGRGGLVTTYEVGVGGWLWVGLEDIPLEQPTPLPSSIKIPGCVPELVSCLLYNVKTMCLK